MDQSQTKILSHGTLPFSRQSADLDQQSKMPARPGVPSLVNGYAVLLHHDASSQTLTSTRKAARLDPKLFALCLPWRLISSMTNLLPAADRQTLPTGDGRHRRAFFGRGHESTTSPFPTPLSAPPHPSSSLLYHPQSQSTNHGLPAPRSQVAGGRSYRGQRVMHSQRSGSVMQNRLPGRTPLGRGEACC